MGVSIYSGFFERMKNKKWLWYTLAGLDVAITVFLFVIHIIMIANISGATTPEAQEALRNQPGLIGLLAKNTILYLVAFVIPLFVILAVNIVALVLYVKKQTKKEPVKVSDLSDEQKEALKKQLLEDLKKGNE